MIGVLGEFGAFPGPRTPVLIAVYIIAPLAP